MKVGELASKPVVTCRLGAAVVEVAREMHETNVGAIVVVDDDQRPVGIVTDRDLVLRVMARELPSTTPVSEVMTGDVLTAMEEDDPEHVLQRAGAWGCRRVPVVAGHGAVVGMVTLDDLTAHLADSMVALAQAERGARHRR